MLGLSPSIVNSRSRQAKISVRQRQTYRFYTAQQSRSPSVVGPPLSSMSFDRYLGFNLFLEHLEQLKRVMKL